MTFGKIVQQATTWRQIAAPIIAEVLRQTKGWDEPDIRRALREAYPFGMRKYWPYKVWLDEIRRQRGFAPKKADYTDKNQRQLF